MSPQQSPTPGPFGRLKQLPDPLLMFWYPLRKLLIHYCYDRQHVILFAKFGKNLAEIHSKKMILMKVTIIFNIAKRKHIFIATLSLIGCSPF